MPGLVQLRSETGPSLRDSPCLAPSFAWAEARLKPTPTIFASLRDFGMSESSSRKWNRSCRRITFSKQSASTGFAPLSGARPVCNKLKAVNW
jgi:hypothetical protein